MDLPSLAALVGIVFGILTLVSGGYRICTRRRQSGVFSIRQASRPGNPLALRLEHVGAGVVYQLFGQVRWIFMGNLVSDEYPIQVLRLVPGESIPIPVPTSGKQVGPMRFDELATCADYLEIRLSYALVPRPRRKLRAHLRVGVTHLGADRSRYDRVEG